MIFKRGLLSLEQAKRTSCNTSSCAPARRACDQEERCFTCALCAFSTASQRVLGAATAFFCSIAIIALSFSFQDDDAIRLSLEEVDNVLARTRVFHESSMAELVERVLAAANRSFVGAGQGRARRIDPSPGHRAFRGKSPDGQPEEADRRGQASRLGDATSTSHVHRQRIYSRRDC
eukprot:766297-Hanusia_phi.AAC.1